MDGRRLVLRIARSLRDSRPRCTVAQRRWRGTVAVAMSGGVDSAVTALLLKRRGFECVGVYMKNWDAADEQGKQACPHEQDLRDMEEVCRRLDMPTVKVDFCREYWTDVFEPFLDSYRTGIETPNPDVYCNRHVKFHHLRNFVFSRLNVQFLATGHYARLAPAQREGESFSSSSASSSSSSRVRLLRGLDATKDQSYFLSMTHGEMFENVLFPVGAMHKRDVKLLAQEHFAGLNVLAKKESMGICFIGKRPMRDFLSQYIELTPGRFVDWDTGDVVGAHAGSETLTLGQKARIGGAAEKFFIAAKAPPVRLLKSHQRGDVYVVKGGEHPVLFRSSLSLPLSGFHWIAGEPPDKLSQAQTISQTQSGQPVPLQYKARYGQPVSECVVSLDPHTQRLTVRFAAPQRALTPGQIFALYDGEECLGAMPIPTDESEDMLSC